MNNNVGKEKHRIISSCCAYLRFIRRSVVHAHRPVIYFDDRNRALSLASLWSRLGPPPASRMTTGCIHRRTRAGATGDSVRPVYFRRLSSVVPLGEVLISSVRNWDQVWGHA